MADTPISGMTAANALSGTEVLAGLQSGANRKISVAQIKALLDTFYQALDPELTALAGLTSAADLIPYFTGSGAAGTTALTAAARTFLAATNAAGQQSAMGLGSAALLASGVLAQIALANIFTNVQAVTPYRTTISGAVSIDLAGTAKSNNLHLTLIGNVTSFALLNPVDGAVYNVRLIQDGTGSRTFSGLPAAFKIIGPGTPAYPSAANAWGFFSAEWGSTEATYATSCPLVSV